MNHVQSIFSNELIEALGWTIIHSLWQATAIAVGITILFYFMRKNSAQVKYLLSFVALIVVLIWSATTFVHSYNYAKEKLALKEKIVTTPGYLKSLLAENITEKTDQTVSEPETINIKIIRLRSFFQRNFNLICTIWLIGLLFFILRFIGGFVYTRKLRSHQLTPLTGEWLEKIIEIADKLGINRTVQAFFSPLATSPMTLGTLKPIILFPVSAFTGLSPKQIEAIIAHELAHVLRHDYLFNFIQSLVDILFFYHPAVWLISTHIRNERENSCDNIAIETTGDKVAFVKALASIQIQSMKDEQLAMAFSQNKNNVLQRIKRLQKQVAMKTNFIEGLIAAWVIVIGLTLASFTLGSPVNSSIYNEEKIESTPVVKRTEAQKDSIMSEMEAKIQEVQKKNQNTEELEKVIEVALSEQNEELSDEIMVEINEALTDLDINKIVREAMHEAASAMKEAAAEVEQARREIDQEGINRDMREAARDIQKARREMEEDMRRDMAKDGISQEVIDAAVSAATAGMDVAASVVGSLDIEGIVSAALTGVSAALKSVGEIDHDTSHHQHWEYNYDTDQKAKEKQTEKEKKQLEKEKAKLQKELEKLQKKIEKLFKFIKTMI